MTQLQKASGLIQMPSSTSEVVTASEGKKIGECTISEVGDMIRGVIATIGLREVQIPKGQVKELFITQVYRELANSTREEVHHALSLAMHKKIDFDTQLYDAMISVDYFIRLMVAYKQYRGEHIINHRRLTVSHHNQLPQADIKSIMIEDIKALWRKVKECKDIDDDWFLVMPAQEAKYIFLETQGIINLTIDEKWEIYERAKEIWRNEIEHDLMRAEANMDRPNIRMLRDIMNDFDLQVTDTTNKARIKQYARVLSLRDWMYELRDNNQELPKLTK